MTLASGREMPAGRFTMMIHRDKVMLRKTEVEHSADSVRLFAQIKGDKLSFTTGKTQLDFIDIFPLSAAGPGVFGVVLSNGTRLDTLQARKQQLPLEPSRLERGDSLYGRRLFDHALEEFARVETTTEQADVKGEAIYKKGLCLVELGRVTQAKPIFEKLAAEKGRWQILAACQVWKLLLKLHTPKAIEEADQIFDNLSANIDYADLALVLSEDERDGILSYYRQYDHYARINWNAARVRNLKRALDIQDLVKGDRIARQRTLWRLADAYRLDRRDRDAVDTLEKLIQAPDLDVDDRIGITRDYTAVMIAAGRPAVALGAIEKYLGHALAGQVDPYLPMLLDRAKLRRGAEVGPGGGRHRAVH